MSTVIVRKWNKYIRCQHDYYSIEMKTLLKDIDHHINNALLVLKDDPTSTVVVVNINNQDLVIKRANTKDWTHILRRGVAASRAKKNWHNAEQLLKLGIQTFSPVAILENRWGPFKGKSYLICTYIKGTKAIDYFAEKNKNSLWEKVVNNIDDLITLLAKHWISHRDLNLSNLIIIDSKPWLIDLDSMRQHKWKCFAKRGARRERERFRHNWINTPGLSMETKQLFHNIFTKN